MTISDLVAKRLKEGRIRLDLTTKTLADRCAALGAPQLTASVLMNIESGRKDANGRRRRAVTVDELLILAYALEVSPLPMLLPEHNSAYPITDEVVTSARAVYEWFMGERPPPLPKQGEDDPVTDDDRERAWFEFFRLIAYAGSPDVSLDLTSWRSRAYLRAFREQLPPERLELELLPERYLNEHAGDANAKETAIELRLIFESYMSCEKSLEEATALQKKIVESRGRRGQRAESEDQND